MSFRVKKHFSQFRTGFVPLKINLKETVDFM